MKEDFMEGKSGNTGHNELFYFGMQQQTHDVRTMHNLCVSIISTIRILLTTVSNLLIFTPPQTWTCVTPGCHYQSSKTQHSYLEI